MTNKQLMAGVLSLLGLSLFSINALAGKVAHVNPDCGLGTDCDGSSWEKGYTTISAAKTAGATLILLSPGTHTVTSTLSFTAAVAIKGSGKGLTTISFDDSSTTSKAITLSSSADGSRLSDFTLEDFDTDGPGIEIDGVDNVLLERIAVNGFTTGVHIKGTGAENKLVDVDVDGSGQALKLSDSNMGYVSGNILISSSVTTSVLEVADGNWSFYSSRVESECTSSCNDVIEIGTNADNVQLLNIETKSGSSSATHIDADNSLTQIDNHLFRKCTGGTGGGSGKVTGTVKLADNHLCVAN